MKIVMISACVLVVYLRPANGFIFICIAVNAYKHVCAVAFSHFGTLAQAVAACTEAFIGIVISCHINLYACIGFKLRLEILRYFQVYLPLVNMICLVA